MSAAGKRPGSDGRRKARGDAAGLRRRTLRATRVVDPAEHKSSRTPGAGALLRRAERGILSESDVATLLEIAREMLGSDLLPESITHSAVLEQQIRFGAVGTRCREARERLGWSIEDATSRLRVARYRVRAIEERRLGELDAEILSRYVDLLGIGRWFERWARVHAGACGLEMAHGRRKR